MMKNVVDAVTATIVAGAAVTGLVVCAALTNGFALSLAWKWILVPSFGAPPITTSTAIGLAMIVSSLLPIQGTKDEEGLEALSRFFLILIGRPAVLILCSWIVSFFI